MSGEGIRGTFPDVYIVLAITLIAMVSIEQRVNPREGLKIFSHDKAFVGYQIFQPPLYIRLFFPLSYFSYF